VNSSQNIATSRDGEKRETREIEGEYEGEGNKRSGERSENAIGGQAVHSSDYIAAGSPRRLCRIPGRDLWCLRRHLPRKQFPPSLSLSLSVKDNISDLAHVGLVRL
jgi:hypothetical protein